MIQQPAPRPGQRLYWFAHELAYLRAQWLRQSADQIAAYLGRTRHSVRHQAKRLGLRRETLTRRWTEDRRARFVATFDRSPVAACREFGLSMHTAREYRMRFSRMANRYRENMNWTRRELDLVRDLYPAGRFAELRERLPHRSEHAIAQAASRHLGPTLRLPLRPDQAQLIAEQYPTTPTADLAAALGMNPDRVRAHARRLGIPKAQLNTNPKANP